MEGEDKQMSEEIFKSNRKCGRPTIWTEKDLMILKENYSNSKGHVLLEMLPGKSLDQIRRKAQLLNLKKEVSCSKADISWMLDLEKPENLYWWGFLTADGCFIHDSIRLKISVKDLEHLKKYAKKINGEITKIFRTNAAFADLSQCNVTASDKFIMPKIKERFKILKQKTYNPFDISEFMTKDKIINFLAGWIDGDGHINPDGRQISMISHSSWENNFRLVSNALQEHFQIKSSVYVDKHGFAKFYLGIRSEVKRFKSLIDSSCPILERKWSRIDSPITRRGKNKNRLLSLQTTSEITS